MSYLGSIYTFSCSSLFKVVRCCSKCSGPWQAVQLTDEEYDILEERQAQRRTFLTGRRRKDETREPATKDDIRTSLLLNKHQYDIVREIALREGMTIKDLISAMFQLGIDRYEEKHGKVELRKKCTDKKDFFK